MPKDIITIFSGSPMDAEIVKEILADNEIIAHVKNQLMGQIAPWQVSAGGVDPVEVEVLIQDQEKAQSLVNEFQNS